VVFEARHVAAKEYSQIELGYVPDEEAAVNKHISSGAHPGRLIYNEAAKLWYVFVGDEELDERSDGRNFDWVTLGHVTERFPAMSEVLCSEKRDGVCWDWNPPEGRCFLRE
jgi:hypothetical protein